MIRRTVVLECDDTEELEEATNYCRSRKDGGRTVIKLTGGPYYLDKPMYFPSLSRVTIDLNWFELSPYGDGVQIHRSWRAT